MQRWQLKSLDSRYILTTIFPVYGICFQLINSGSLIKSSCTALIERLLLLLLFVVSSTAHWHETEKKTDTSKMNLHAIISLEKKVHRAQSATRLLNGARCSRTARLKVVLFFDPQYEKYRWRECVCDIMDSSMIMFCTV